MDVNVFDTLCFGSFDEFENVGDVRMDTSVRDETTEVESGSVLFGVLQLGDNVGLTSEFLLLDAYESAPQLKCPGKPTLINPDDILPDNSASTDVQMTAVSTTSSLQKK